MEREKKNSSTEFVSNAEGIVSASSIKNSIGSYEKT